MTKQCVGGMGFMASCGRVLRVELSVGVCQRFVASCLFFSAESNLPFRRTNSTGPKRLLLYMVIKGQIIMVRFVNIKQQLLHRLVSSIEN